MTGRGVGVRMVRASAPIRVCDIGGWTDTWFAGHGNVCNIAMAPGVEVRIHVRRAAALPTMVVLDVAAYGERYGFDLDDVPGRHPLLEATLEHVGIPDDVSVEVTVSSSVPAGSSTGTSAAVTVALLGALDVLRDGRMSPAEVASAAHRIEVERLGTESGIQDQLCATHGGISYIEMTSYPDATVSPVAVTGEVWAALEDRLVLVSLGRAHRSSAMHERVIARLNTEGPASPHLEALRRAARRARDALLVGDLEGFGEVMKDNTAAQAELHPELVGPHARTVIEIAAAHGAWGSKVNGAGGEGGSVTVLCGPDPERRSQLSAALREADPRYRVMPVRVSHQGLAVTED